LYTLEKKTTSQQASGSVGSSNAARTITMFARPHSTTRLRNRTSMASCTSVAYTRPVEPTRCENRSLK
jgi:hypothetical protein